MPAVDPDCVKTRPRQMRRSGRAGAEVGIEPEWREGRAIGAFPRARCGAVPEGLKFLGFSHSQDHERPVSGGS